MTRVTGLPWLRVAAALPAVALVGTGVALAAGGGAGSTDVVAQARPAVTVPPAPVTRLNAPVLPPLPQLGELPAPAEAEATTLEAPAPGSAAALPDSMTVNGIPAAALAAYRRAAQLVDAADAQCRIDWALVAAIGKVESDHGRYGGNGIDGDGTVRPGIYGIPLNGSNQTAVIRDTDAGAFDRDTAWDRAVGPMQFIPETWRVVGVDANGDGRKDPQNLADAATATAVYLCSGPGDLSTPAGARSAVLRYNHSDAYADQVLAIATGYRGGFTVVPGTGLTESQRTGAPYLPSGDPQTMGTYDAALAARPAPVAAGSGKGSKSRTSAGSSTGSGSSRGTTGAGGATGGTGSGSSGSAGSSGSTGGGTSSPSPSTTAAAGSLTGALAGATHTVGTVVGGLTTSTRTPRPSTSTSSPTPTPSTTSSTTSPLPLTVLPKNGVCPSGYRLDVLGTLCVRI